MTGYKNSEGRIPPIVEAHNFQCRAACAIARANLTHERGAVLVETPALRRAGSEDATPGCEKHVYMYDFPAWVALIEEKGGVVLNFDQCSYLDHPGQGKSQLFRRTVTLGEAAAIFANPRVHTGRGYHKTSEQQYRPDQQRTISCPLCGRLCVRL